MIDCLSTPLSVIYALQKMHVPSTNGGYSGTDAEAAEAAVHIVFIGTSAKVREYSYIHLYATDPNDLQVT